MYIGLIDDDLREKASYPNLELMKLASFHKQNRDIIELVTDYRQYERYTKIYFRKNINNNDIPSLFLSKARGKCDYGGYAFTNGIYIPMEKEIEKSLPDFTIYDKIKKERKKFNAWLDKGLIRLQTCDTLPTSQNDKYLVYDKQVTNYDLWDELVKIAKKIELVEPQYFDDFDKAVEFAKEQKIFFNTVVKYNGLITADMAATVKNVDLKVPIYYDLIPEKYSKVSFDVGTDIILSYMDHIENIFSKNTKLKPYNIFKDSFLSSAMVDICNLTTKVFGLIEARKGTLKSNKYITLINRIKRLRRYK